MKTLFWDFHGTLIRAEKLWSKSLYQAIKHCWPDCGITLEQLSANQHPGTFPWDDPERDYRHLTDPDKWWQAMEQQFAAISQRCGLSAAEAAQVAPTVRGRILEPSNFHLYEDAIQTLELLSNQGWHHILLSNNFPELPALMDQLDISHFFDQQIVSALVGFEKPHPEIFALAIECAGHPETCVMIGDNPHADAWGALQAGIDAILVHPRGEINLAVPVCQNLSDLVPLLQEYRS
jgi:putative hydrolase of the HAD superfamily